MMYILGIHGNTYCPGTISPKEGEPHPPVYNLKYTCPVKDIKYGEDWYCMNVDPKEDGYFEWTHTVEISLKVYEKHVRVNLNGWLLGKLEDSSRIEQIKAWCSAVEDHGTLPAKFAAAVLINDALKTLSVDQQLELRLLSNLPFMVTVRRLKYFGAGTLLASLISGVLGMCGASCLFFFLR